jgi:hypothetical protein
MGESEGFDGMSRSTLGAAAIERRPPVPTMGSDKPARALYEKECLEMYGAGFAYWPSLPDETMDEYRVRAGCPSFKAIEEWQARRPKATTLASVRKRMEVLASRGRHVKTGWMLRDLSYEQITDHLHSEVSELDDELRGDTPDALYEMADVLCIAMHIAVRRGWTLADLAQAMHDKLDVRFEVE